MSDFACELCHAPVGIMVQGKACIFRCSKCSGPGQAALLSLFANDLRSCYKAVLLNRESEELAVVAEGIGAEIVPQVLAAAADGAFVWMKPL